MIEEDDSRAELVGSFLRMFDRNAVLLMKVNPSQNHLYKIILETRQPTPLLTTLETQLDYDMQDLCRHKTTYTRYYWRPATKPPIQDTIGDPPTHPSIDGITDPTWLWHERLVHRRPKSYPQTNIILFKFGVYFYLTNYSAFVTFV